DWIGANSDLYPMLRKIETSTSALPKTGTRKQQADQFIASMAGTAYGFDYDKLVRLKQVVGTAFHNLSTRPAAVTEGRLKELVYLNARLNKVMSGHPELAEFAKRFDAN